MDLVFAVMDSSLKVLRKDRSKAQALGPQLVRHVQLAVKLVLRVMTSLNARLVQKDIHLEAQYVWHVQLMNILMKTHVSNVEQVVLSAKQDQTNVKFAQKIQIFNQMVLVNALMVSSWTQTARLVKLVTLLVKLAKVLTSAILVQMERYWQILFVFLVKQMSTYRAMNVKSVVIIA